MDVSSQAFFLRFTQWKSLPFTHGSLLPSNPVGGIPEIKLGALSAVSTSQLHAYAYKYMNRNKTTHVYEKNDY